MAQRSVATPDYLQILNTPSVYSRASLPKVAQIGSSYTQQQTTVSGNSLIRNSRSWIGWWHTFSGGAFNCDDFIYASDALSRGFAGSNFGVSGQDSTTILARIQGPIAAGADMIILQSGSNNASSPSTVIADVQASIDAIYAAGIICVYLAISARGTGSWSATVQSQAFQINQSIRNYCKTTGKAIYIDPNVLLIDNTAASGRPYTNAIDSDEIHYNQYSAFQIGKLLHQCLTPLLPLTPQSKFSYADSYDATNNPYGNLSVNPFFSTDAAVGSTNGSVGTGVTAGTGTASTSVARNVVCERNSGSGTAVATVESRGAGKGNWQVLTITPAGGAGTSVFYTRRGSADQTSPVPTSNTWFIASCDVEVSAFGTDALYSGFRSAPSVFVDTRDGSGTKGKVTGMDIYSTSYNLPNEAWSGRIFSPPFQMPSTADRIRPRIEINIDDNMAGTGIVKAGSLMIEPIQSPLSVWGLS